MKLLIHLCCANCGCYPLQKLRADEKEVFGFFFNPNIHPYTEYRRRLEAVEEFSRKTGLRVIYRDQYLLEEFLRAVSFRESQRCHYCYYWRLDETARVAKRGKFEAFTTTLLYSKQQKHDLIRQIAEEVSKKRSVSFYYEDFRQGWREGIELSRSMGLYRQSYCGCIYSERDRFGPEDGSQRERSFKR